VNICSSRKDSNCIKALGGLLHEMLLGKIYSLIIFLGRNSPTSTTFERLVKSLLKTAYRSFALFGGAALAHQFMCSTEGNSTFLQDSIASMCGAFASITVAAPLDVIKTRIQR